MLFVKERLPVLEPNLPVRVVPLFLLVGFHTGRDLFDGEDSVCACLARQGYTVLQERRGLMERDSIHGLLCKKIEKVFL